MSTDYSSLMVHEMWNWIEERAAANVLYAKAVSEVTAADGIVTIVLDPEGRTGATEEAFYGLDLIPQMASVFGSVFSADDEVGGWMRENITSLRVTKADGQVVQQMSADELHRRATEF